ADGCDVQRGAPRRAQGFRLGFALALMIVTALLLTYMHAPKIAKLAPFTQEPLSQYVTAVNDGRAWLDNTLMQAVEARLGDES
ncbi:MAG: hypothetical protein AAFV38_04040, partial [Pseudomonadota bacterium]